jgi:adenine/guanine phosphoribosyltransferase-like PRPP-binding protein
MTIVDDVVTKGATLLACATLLQATFQGATVRGFGLVRTRGLQPEVEKIVDPCVGLITWNGGSVDRQP